jgi:hypothetical protein
VVFRVDIRDRAVFASGWGRVELADGLAFRWMEAEQAVLDLTSLDPWQALRVHCRFADAVRRDVHVIVLCPDADQRAVGALRWLGHGMHHQTVTLDRPVPAGRCSVHLDPIQTWREPGGTRSLSVAFAAISGRPRRRMPTLPGRPSRANAARSG